MIDRKVVLVVDGMSCSACTNSINGQVSKLDGVGSCDIFLVTNECIVTYSGKGLNAERVKECIEDTGFDCQIVSDEAMTFANYLTVGILTIQGMTCSACTNSVTQQVSKLDGVNDVKVSLVTEECCVKYDANVVSIESIQESIEDCGFDCCIVSTNNEDEAIQKTQSKIKSVQIKLIKYNAELDSAELQSFFNNVGTVGELTDISLPRSTVTIQFDEKSVGIRRVVSSLKEFGYDVLIESNMDNTTQLTLLSKIKEIRFWFSSFIVTIIASSLNMSIYMWIPMLFPRFIKEHYFPYNEFLTPGLYTRDVIGFVVTTFIQVYIGTFFYKATWSSYKHGSGTMDTLICISTTLAYTFSVYSILCNIVQNPNNGKLPNVTFSTATMLFSFISFGKLLENKAKSQTSTALSKLISLSPTTCTIFENGDRQQPISIPTEYLETGDIIEVKPGMKIPADGILIEGETEVDESLMTGESNLVVKHQNDSVIGGSINVSGRFLFEAINVGQETKLANIIKTMKGAQMAKAPIQRYADYLASVFVPCILTLAILTFIIWEIICHTFETLPSLFTKNSNSHFFVCLQTAISVVVVACPCALGLAAPTAIMVGTGIGAEHGILIKGGDKLELFNNIDVFVFDKTGTLTTGCMSVENFINVSNVQLTKEVLAALIAAVSINTHPVSNAIENYCETLMSNDSSNYSVTIVESKNLVGSGLVTTCTINGKEFKVAVGSKHLMTEDALKKFTSMKEHTTVAYFSINDEVIGRFDIIDEVKVDAHDTVQYLSSKGHKCYMVTGDIHESALKVAQQVGIDLNNVFSEVTPDGKSARIKQLQNDYNKKVAFIGDGINDSPALVSSDVGISISTGTDIAIEAADVVVLSEQSSARPTLKRIVYAFDISQKTFRRIKLNLFWAIFYNTFMIPIAMGLLMPWGITLHPMAASLAMAMSSVSVVISSLALKSWKPIKLTADTFNLGRNKSWLHSLFLSNSRFTSTEDIELNEGLLDEL